MVGAPAELTRQRSNGHDALTAAIRHDESRHNTPFSSGRRPQPNRVAATAASALRKSHPMGDNVGLAHQAVYRLMWDNVAGIESRTVRVIVT